MTCKRGKDKKHRIADEARQAIEERRFGPLQAGELLEGCDTADERAAAVAVITDWVREFGRGCRAGTRGAAVG